MGIWVSYQNGNWSVPIETFVNDTYTSPWHGGVGNPATGVPVTGDTVTIAAGHTVTYDVADKVTISGITYPASGINGVYTATGLYNNQLYYTNGTYYLWWRSSTSKWQITQSLGTLGSSYFTGPVVTTPPSNNIGGTWVATGWTGTVVIALATPELAAVTIDGTLSIDQTKCTRFIVKDQHLTISSTGEYRCGTPGTAFPKDYIHECLINTTVTSGDGVKGIPIAAGGKLNLYGDPTLYGEDYDTTIADYCEVSGTLTPDVTGMYFPDSTYGGQVKYKRNGLVSGTQYYLWWASDASRWILDATPGTWSSTLRWVGPSLNNIGYGPMDGASGTATVTNGWNASTTSKTFTVNGAFATKWSVGQELLIHRNPAVYSNYNTDFAPSTVGPAIISAITANPIDNTLTDITIVGAYANTYFRDGIVLNLSRNIKLGKYNAATALGQTALTNRPLLTDSNAAAGNVNISNAILTGFYRPGGVNTGTGKGVVLNKTVIRHCDIGWFNAPYCTIDAIFYGNVSGCLAGAALCTIDGYFCNSANGTFTGNSNSNTKNICNASIFGMSTALGTLDKSTVNGDIFACVYPVYANVNNCKITSRIYANTNGICSGSNNDISGSLGWNPQGVLQLNTYDLFWGTQASSKNVIRSAKLPSGGLTFGSRNSATRPYSGSYCFENYNQTIGDHRIIDAYGDLIKNTTTVRTGGASSSIEVIPQSNCSIPLPLQILDWKESDVPASSQTRSVFMRGGGSSGWVTYPLATQLWFEAEYLDSASAWTTAIVKTTTANIVLTDNTTWVEFPLTFTPGRQGVVRYRAYLATYAANAEVFVDNQLQRLNDSTLLGVWADGASQLQEQTDMFTDADRTKLDTVISTMALNSTVAKEATLSAGVSSILEATPEVDLTAITNYLDGTTPIAAGSLENVAVSVLPTQTFIQDQTTTSGSLRVKQYSEFLWAQVITDAVGTPVDLTNKDLVLTFYKPNDPNKIPVYRVTTNDTLQKSGNTISLPLLRELTGVARTLHGMLWENDSETVPLYVMELIIEPTVDPEATVPSA